MNIHLRKFSDNTYKKVCPIPTSVHVGQNVFLSIANIEKGKI